MVAVDHGPGLAAGIGDGVDDVVGHLMVERDQLIECECGGQEGAPQRQPCILSVQRGRGVGEVLDEVHGVPVATDDVVRYVLSHLVVAVFRGVERIHRVVEGCVFCAIPFPTVVDSVGFRGNRNADVVEAIPLREGGTARCMRDGERVVDDDRLLIPRQGLQQHELVVLSVAESPLQSPLEPRSEPPIAAVAQVSLGERQDPQRQQVLLGLGEQHVPRVRDAALEVVRHGRVLALGERLESIVPPRDERRTFPER